MTFNQLTIERSGKEICISQEEAYEDDGCVSIYITPEMVDLICNELQQLKNTINQEKK
ncbi:MAG: hypothetical protein J6O99_08150 [Methanobrevibacter sp.]|nr:hypothetical protein [Methanobrevibacter sp.]